MTANWPIAVDDQSPSGGSGALLVLDRRDPMACARAFIEHRYTRDGTCLLHHHRGAFHGWTGAAWPEKDRAGLRAELWTFLELSVGFNREPFRPTSSICNNVLDYRKALGRAAGHLELVARRLSSPTRMGPFRPSTVVW